MSIKDRLSKKTEGLFTPNPELPAASGVAETTTPESKSPRTGPGQMLAFRSHMQESNQRVEELEKRLQAFDGALVQRPLDPKLVKPSRWANRHTASFTTLEFDKLKADIQAAGGNVQPIRVRRVSGPSEAFEIVFGHRRHRACLELGLPVMAVIDQLDDKALFAAMDRENRDRKDLSPYEQGEMYRRALDEGLYGSLRQMALDLGVDAGNVSKAIAIARLPSEVLSAFENPLVIQFRWGQRLHAAVQKDPDGIIGRAKAIRSSPRKIASAEVLSRLLGERRHIKASSTPFKINGKTLGSMSRQVDGAVKIQLVAGAVDDDQLVAIRLAIETALTPV